MGTFNTYGERKRSYGGAYPVWLTVSQKERCGGTLKELPPAGSIIPAGTPVSIESNIATPIVIYQVIGMPKAAFELATNHNTVQPTVGMTLMIAPKTYPTSESLKGCTVKSVEKDPDSGNYKITFVESFGSVWADMILISCDKAGTSCKLNAIPTGLTENDVWIEDGDTAATVASVFHGEIMEDRIQPIPDFLKQYLPMIKFVKGV